MDNLERTDENPQPALAAIEITKTYRDIIAVDHMSLTVNQGEIMALLGPNGAGKTTFMRIVSGLLKPDAGTIWMYGEQRSSMARESFMFGYCPQRLVIWKDLTCMEQLVYVANMYGIPRRTGEKRAAQLLSTLGLRDKTNNLAAHLSGGMRRRLSLAIAMVHDPNIYILDEPAAGLDPQSRVLIREHIRSLRLQNGKTIIVSTHDMAEADRLADRVAIMDRGKLLALGPPQRLKEYNGRPNLIEIVLSNLSNGQGESALRELSMLNHTVRQLDNTLLLDVEDGAELIRPIRSVLGRLDITPLELRHRTRTLEDVFIDLTGRNPRG